MIQQVILFVPKIIKIDNIEYIPRSESVLAQKLDGLDYVIIRTYSAGVFAGYLKERKDKEVKLLNARRLWAWYGAASIYQLAVDGVSKPNDCKFPCEVEEIILTEAIEIVPCTEKARLSINSVKIWKE